MAPLSRDRHRLERSTQVGFTRLARIWAPISGKPEIGVCSAPQRRLRKLICVAALRPGHESAATQHSCATAERANNQPPAVGDGRPLHCFRLLFTMDGATPTCRVVSARGGSDHALSGVGSRGAGRQPTTMSQRGVSAAVTIRPGACPHRSQRALAAQPESSSGHKKSPRRVAPPGVVSSSRHASIKERCRGGRGCEVRSCPDSGSGRRRSAWRCYPTLYRSRWRPSMPSPASDRSHRSPHRTTV
jgi:hypothetical protein